MQSLHDWLFHCNMPAQSPVTHVEFLPNMFARQVVASRHLPPAVQGAVCKAPRPKGKKGPKGTERSDRIEGRQPGTTITQFDRHPRFLFDFLFPLDFLFLSDLLTE